MKTIQDFIKRYPLLSYVILVFAISWGAILIVVGRDGFAPSGEQGGMLFVLIYLAMLAGPSIAGIVLTGVVNGRAGLRDLVSRLLKWRVGARWYAAALFIAPLAITAVLVPPTPRGSLFSLASSRGS